MQSKSLKRKSEPAIGNSHDKYAFGLKLSFIFIIFLIAGGDQKFREYLITDNEERKQPNKYKEKADTIYEMCHFPPCG